MEGATCREGAIFGGECKVKAKFGGGASLGPCFCQKFIQAIDLKGDIGQIPRSKGGNAQDMDQAFQPLIKI